MFDFHSHIIPDIDDGAEDLDTAMEMLQMASSHGTTAMVATPHVVEGNLLPSWERILAGRDLLRDRIQSLGIKLAVYPGAEVAMNMDLLQLFHGPGPYCVNEGQYMLVELPALEIPGFVDDFFFRLQSRGIKPVLAHPERHPLLMKHPQRLLEWLRRGILTQVNASSIMGRMGGEAQEMAELMLRNQMVHFIGSDAHGTHNRRPKLDGAAARIGELVGTDAATVLLRTNPKLLIEGKELKVPEIAQLAEPRPKKKGFGWFGGWK